MNLQHLKQLGRPFELSDFDFDGERSDGITECEEIIRNAGGKVSRDFFITPPVAYENVVSHAINYLIDEWDYAFESWRNNVTLPELVKISSQNNTFLENTNMDTSLSPDELEKFLKEEQENSIGYYSRPFDNSEHE